MSRIVEFVSFRLKEGVSMPDFLLVSDRLNAEFITRQRGYLGRKLIADGGLWADLVLWATLEDAQNAARIFAESAIAGEYMAYIDEASVDFHHFTIAKDYQPTGEGL